MNRIDQIFVGLRQQQRGALMPFVTAGDPSLAVTGELIEGLADAGASVIEVGIPFSDPIADGPVIQASMTRALEHGVTIEEVFETVGKVRPRVDVGLVAMVSYSIVHRISLKTFVRDAMAAGFDGFIFPDLPLDESDAAAGVVAEAGGILSQLIAPTTPDDRAARIAKASTGFGYVVARSGITGEKAELPSDLIERLTKLKAVTKIPLAVGFGVSKPEHVKDIVSVADAVIVGSALVRRIHEAAASDAMGPVEAAKRFMSDLALGLSEDHVGEACQGVEP